MAWIDVQACTLPTVDQPMRLAEFDASFADHRIEVVVESATGAVFLFAGGDDVMKTLADFTARESQCCSFFEFDLDHEKDGVRLVVAVPTAYAEVLAALVERATLVAEGDER